MKLYGVDDEIIISGYGYSAITIDQGLIHWQGEPFHRLLHEPPG
jgi:hypothetical protein